MEKNFGLSCCWKGISIPSDLILNNRMKPLIVFLLTACSVHASATTPVNSGIKAHSQDENSNTDLVQTSEWSKELVLICNYFKPTPKYPTPLIQLLALFDTTLIVLSGKSVKVFSDKKMSCCDYHNNVLMKQQCCQKDDTEKSNNNRSYVSTHRVLTSLF